MADDKKIFISIDVNAKGSAKASKEIDKNTKSTDRLAAAKKKLAYLQSEEAQRLAVTNQQIKIQTEVNDALAKSELGLATTKAAAIAQQKQFRAQAGLNNAILLETGRLASDASFGFTAIANNLSQLVSLFGSFSRTAGGVGKSLKLLGSSLMGTGGVLLAVQLLIGALQSKAVMDFVKSLGGLTGRLKELSDLSKAYSEELGRLTGNFRLYTDILLDSTSSEEQKTIALKKLNDEYPEYNSELIKERKNLEDINKENEKFIKLLQERALSVAAQSKLEEIASEFGLQLLESRIELIQAEQDEVQKTKKVQELVQQVQEETNRGRKTALQEQLGFAIREQKSLRTRIKNLKEETKEFTKEYDDRRAVITSFVKLRDKEEDKSGKKSARARVARFGEFKQGLFNLDQQIEKINQEILKKDLKREESKITNAEFNEKQLLRVRLNTFRERQQLRQKEFEEAQAKRLEDFLSRKKQSEKTKKELAEDVRARESFNKAISNSREELNDSLVKGEVELNEALVAVDKKYNAIRTRLRNKFRDEINSIFLSRQKSELDANQTFFKERQFQLTMEIEAEKAKMEALAKLGMDSLEEQRNLALKEDELRKVTFDKEKQFVENKKRINLEYVSFSKGISDLLGTIAGENQALQKAALVLEKGSAIADVVINAQSSIATRTAQANAIAPFLPTPAGIPIPNPAYAISQAAAAKDNARTKVGAAIAIANILATTLTSAKSPSGGDGGARGGVEVEAPDFNVVGASPESQLAQSVAQQQTEPLRAFVVGKDITSQQELDRNILTNAGLGD